MNNQPPTDEQLWAYVHGELPAGEQDALEKAVKENEALSERLDGIQAMNRQLRDKLPLAGPSLDALEEHILENWEKDHPAAYQKPQVEKPSKGGSLLGWPGSKKAWFPPLALAACILIVVGLNLHDQGPIQWEIETQTLAYRGNEAPQPVYSQESLSQAGTQLQKAIDAAYKEEGFRPEPGWNLKVLVAELPEKAVMVTLSGTTETGDGVMAIEKTYPSLEALSQETGPLADLVTGRLIQPGTN